MKNDSGRIPLSWAAQSGDEGIVKLLLYTGVVRADMTDDYCLRLLCWAAESWYGKIVQLLLKTDRIDPNAKDKDERTPLLLVLQAAHNPPPEAVVFTLKRIRESFDTCADYWMRYLLRQEQGPGLVRIAREEMCQAETV